MIPRNLYSAWEGPPPEFVRWCLYTFRVINPDWEVRLLDVRDTAVPGKPPTPAHRADWVRMFELYEHGGVWVDASCICLRPLEDWVELRSDRFQAFKFAGAASEDVAENWAFACPPRHPLLGAWKDEFRKALELGFENYRISLPVATQELFGTHLPYLSAHAAFYETLRLQPELKGTCKLLSATQPGQPFHYIARHDWKSFPAIVQLWSSNPCIIQGRLFRKSCAAVLPQCGDGAPFWKLRGAERSCWMTLEKTLVGIVLMFLVLLALGLWRASWLLVFREK